MAKKKIANPLFLEFINHPHKGECAGCDPWESAEYCLRNLFEKSDILPCHVHPDVLKKAIKDFDLNNNKFIGSIIEHWRDIRVFVTMSIMNQEKSHGGETLDNLEIFKIFPKLLPAGITPFLYRNNKDGFEVKLASVEPTEGSLPTPELIKIISVDFISFLLKRYKPGIFAVCKLDGCDNVIITVNGLEYCCRSHVQKASRDKIKKDKNKYLYKKERGRLCKQFIRKQLEGKCDREEFIRKNWNKNIKHLYKPPQK